MTKKTTINKTRLRFLKRKHTYKNKHKQYHKMIHKKMKGG